MKYFTKKQIWIIVTTVLLMSSVVYANTWWTIWSLFQYVNNWIETGYRLLWTNILDGTITSDEIATNSIWNDELDNNDSFSMNTVLANQYNLSSDIRYKKDIKKLDNSLEKILQLNWYSYTLKENWKQDIWIIAQEVEKIFPELVNINEVDWHKSVQYMNLIAPLIEAIKEQQKQINLLEKKLSEKY